MVELTEKQQKRLKKMASFLEDKDISTFETLLELQEKVDDLTSQLDEPADVEVTLNIV